MQRVHERKQEKENLELVGCTFHPNILQSPASQYSSHSKVGNSFYQQNNNNNS